MLTLKPELGLNNIKGTTLNVREEWRREEGRYAKNGEEEEEAQAEEEERKPR